MRQYKQEMAALKANVDDIEKVPKDEDKKLKAVKAKAHLEDKNKKRARPKFDPNDLPNKSLSPTASWSAGGKLDTVSQSQLKHEPAG